LLAQQTEQSRPRGVLLRHRELASIQRGRHGFPEYDLRRDDVGKRNQ
jgi:hypothetical protein